MFIWIGAIGALLLVLALVAGDLLEGLVPDSDWLSLTAITTFMSAFGLAGYLVDSGIGAPLPVALIAGGAAGTTLGYVATRWSRSLSGMATDKTPTSSDLIGCQGRVVTPIPPNSTGEVLIRLGGQPVKLTAVAASDQSGTLEQQTEIVVVGVLSSTRVEVQAAESFWT